ncbi:MAG: hypothetical protein ACOH1Y_11270 [Propionicimonas sp.]
MANRTEETSIDARTHLEALPKPAQRLDALELLDLLVRRIWSSQDS